MVAKCVESVKRSEPWRRPRQGCLAIREGGTTERVARVPGCVCVGIEALYSVLRLPVGGNFCIWLVWQSQPVSDVCAGALGVEGEAAVKRRSLAGVCLSGASGVPSPNASCTSILSGGGSARLGWLVGWLVGCRPARSASFACSSEASFRVSGSRGRGESGAFGVVG